MRFYRGTHRYYCGIDLHARTMYLCLMDQQGTILLHEGIACEPEVLLRLLQPYRDDLVVCAECIFCWYWLADLCAAQGIHFVLAHALYLKAIYGAKSKNDAVDSEKLCTLLRGGAIPQGYVYPPRLRAARDLMRRRLFFTRKRAELLCHIENTFHQYNLAKPAGALSSPPQRAHVADHFRDPVVRASVEADLALCSAYDERIQALETLIEQHARAQEPSALALLRTIPGVGAILGLTILYEIDTIQRFPRVQDFSSYCRLIKPEHSSDGKRVGSGGAKIGSAHLKWAFSEAAVNFLQRNPRGQAFIKRLRKRYGKGKALSILAARLGRATYFMLKERRAFDMDRFLAV